MNMMKDRLAYDLNRPAILDIHVRDYVKKLNGMGMCGLRYRFPSNFPFIAMRGWMLPVLQAPLALKQFASELKHIYGCSFKVKQTSGNTLEDITQALQDGNFVLVHGLWVVTDTKEIHYKFGGIPHTMLPVEIDSLNDKVRLLNPAEPNPGRIDPNDPATYPAAELDEMPTEEFLAFWGRKSFLNLYTRPFTMTVVIPDTKTK
jgi:hypothetical protein